MNVLKIHNIKLDYAALAQAMGENVTAKAIIHRITKLKAIAAADDPDPSTPGAKAGKAKAAKTPSAKGTPAKGKGDATPEGKKAAGKKRGADVMDDDEAMDGAEDAQTGVAIEGGDADGSEEAGDFYTKSEPIKDEDTKVGVKGNAKKRVKTPKKATLSVATVADEED
ncbi:MAG: hypothetical protein M1829_001229 [Trizodia sp. TS-e1964]|nr:MAG: hypothetical protein M1829_001229 [Trizodia sp. TS-e1964]